MMKTITIPFMYFVCCCFHLGLGQEMITNQYWQIGFGLGELPTGGSFKPSITLGYHFNEKIYAGLIVQLKDKISRNQASINAKSTGLDGLLSSAETVSSRFLLQFRFTPLKNGPYVSGGFVWNGRDSETMAFDGRVRQFEGESIPGTIRILQTRPAGGGLALGLGYQYNFKNGISAGFEWTPAWGQYPQPDYALSGTANLSENATRNLISQMNRAFNNSVTNLYKVFHFGLSYQFQNN